MQSALEVIGGKWKLIAVMRIKDGITRFADLQRSLPGISRKQLAQCLRELARDGVIVRLTPSTHSRDVHYEVTPLGAELQAAADALFAWGEHWLDAPRAPVEATAESRVVTER